jgi:predicted ATPase/DNA-binding CsgD family transcriptional regulator
MADSRNVTPGNLPASLTSFIGREREIGEIVRFIAECRLLTLTGEGGCGKSRLALETARVVLEQFADGAWIVELAALSDVGLVPQAVAKALKVPEQARIPMSETLARALRPRVMLLVLDNCEHLLGACAQLANDLLRECPGLHMLATSREPLGVPGEMLWRVPSLSMPDLGHLPPPDQLGQFEAARLFAERARNMRPEFRITAGNARAVAQTCRQLDGMPLAIELAAARVRTLTVEQIAARLDDRFRLLTGGGPVVLPRHQTLRATMDWSYDLLSETERLVLRRLSVFARGWSLEAAEAVCSGDIEAAGVLDLLTRLVDKSLVIAETHAREARYRMLETVRQYAWGKLLASGEMANTRMRHRDWYLQLAERANPRLRGTESRAWRDRLEIEHDNLRAALEWSRTEEGGAEAALRLAVALRWFWFLQGHWNEARGWFEGALARSGDAPASALVKPLASAAYYAYRHGDYERTTALCEKGVALCRQLGNTETHSWFLHYLGFAAAALGDYARAASLHEEGLALSRESGDKSLMGFGLAQLGRTAWRQGDLERAGALSNDGLVLGKEVEDKWVIAYALCNLGAVALDQSEYEQAAVLFAEGLARCEEVGDRLDTKRCLEGLAGVACFRGHYERAARLFGAAQILRELSVQLPEPPADRAQYDRYVVALRARFDETSLAAAWAEGRAMTPEEAIAYAREPDQPARRTTKAADPLTLTPREREVAALIAKGLTNRDIAACLVIAERTAEGHVQNILNKLGIRSRAQIAAWAVAEGLSTGRPG